MPIDYTKIIAQANARKDALLVFEANIAELPQVLRQLEHFNELSARLRHCVNSLDTEAKALVGHPKVRAVWQLSCALAGPSSVMSQLDTNGGYSCLPDTNGRPHIDNLRALLGIG